MERDGLAAGITRRRFLAGAAAGLAAAGLTGCTNTTVPSGQPAGDVGPGGIPLARPERPVTLPIYDDNRPIASGLEPEAGPLRLYNWVAYISPDVIAEFERKYGAKVQVTTFSSIDEAMAKVASGAVDFDVTVPGFSDLTRLVAGRLVQPLNHDYLPNLAANVWPSQADPWYDRGARYSLPYGLLSTGYAWRADKLPDFDPGTLSNPYDALWGATAIKGKVGMLDDMREVLAWALLRNGVTDVNTGDPALIAQAEDYIVQLVRRVNLKFATNDFEKLPRGEVWLHHSFSGNMVLAQHFMPKGTSVDVLRYWWPQNDHALIKNDLLVVLRTSKKPVLAHLLLDHLMDRRMAVENFGFTGFQQPVRGSEPDVLVKDGLVPPNLRNTIVTEAQARTTLAEGPLSQRASVLWQNAWSRIKAAG